MQNVVLICLDSVRKDIYDEEMTKTKKLVDVSFNQCRATSSWSVPSHASFLTGQLPSEHGVHTHSLDFSKLDPSEVLTARGEFDSSYSISANQFTSSQFGFDVWFDNCHTISSTAYYPGGLEVWKTEGIADHFVQSLRHEHPIKSLANGAVSASIKLSDQLPIRSPFDDGARTILQVAERLILDASKPSFFFLNLMEAHHPHRMIRGYREENVQNNWSSSDFDLMELNKSGEQLIKDKEGHVKNFRTLYRAAIDYLDRYVFDFIQRIQQNTEKDITFVITADHGENLGYEADDSLFGHTASLSEGLLHVPLDIINPPAEINMDSDRIVSQKELRNISEDLCRGESASIPQSQYVEAELIGGGPLEDVDEYWDRMIRCVYNIESREKIIWDSVGNKYRDDLSGEVSSIRVAREALESVPKWATDQFEVEITEYKRRAKAGQEPAVDSLDSGTKDRLEDLGYL